VSSNESEKNAERHGDLNNKLRNIFNFESGNGNVATKESETLVSVADEKTSVGFSLTNVDERLKNKMSNGNKQINQALKKIVVQ
jgi:hypothetical protein